MNDKNRGNALRSGAERSRDWDGFETRLAEILSALEEDQNLIIAAKEGWGYVQFCGQGSFGLRAETMSNYYRDREHQLSSEQVEHLENLGWLAPTGSPDESTPNRQPDGSPNFFRDFSRPISFDAVAGLAVRTFVEVLGFGHPGRLAYKAFDDQKRDILLPTLGLMTEPQQAPAPKADVSSVEGVRKLVLEAIRKAAADSDLEFDDDGRLSLRFGTAKVVLRVLKTPFCVSIASPVLSNVEPNIELLERLNDLNARMQCPRLFVSDGTVFCALEISASPVVADHVIEACGLVGHTADKIDEMLQKEFGGRTAFGEFSSKVVVH